MKKLPFLLTLILIVLAYQIAYAKIGILSTSQVESLLSKQKNLIIIDVRQKTDYLKAHLPNAINMNESSVVSSTESEIGLMPFNANLAKIFSNFGLKNNATYILYSGENYNNPASFIANAAWIMAALYWSGIKDIYYMDGGFEKWIDDGYKVERGNFKLPKSDFKIKYNSSNVIATKSFILWAISNNVQLIDSRDRDEYLKGHIKGAKWFYAGDFLEKVKNYWMIKPKNLIESLFLKDDIDINKPTISYCQSGHYSSVYWFIANAMFDKKMVWSFCGTFKDLTQKRRVPINIGPAC